MTNKESGYNRRIAQQQQVLARLIPKDQLTTLWGQKAPFYLKQLWDYGLYDLEYGNNAEDMLPLITRLVHGESRINQSIIAELSKRAQKTPSYAVRRARRSLQEFFQSSKVQIMLNIGNYLPVVTGSIQYGDPVNLDADVLLICQKPVPDYISYDIHFTINDTLIDVWEQNKIGTEPHVSIFCIDDFTTKKFEEDPELWFLQTENCSQAYTGMPILPNDTNKLMALRPKILEAIHQSPVTTAIANEALSNCLKLRIQRAK